MQKCPLRHGLAAMPPLPKGEASIPPAKIKDFAHPPLGKGGIAPCGRLYLRQHAQGVDGGVDQHRGEDTAASAVGPG